VAHFNRVSAAEIALVFGNHNPPHFHVPGREGAAQVRIDTLSLGWDNGQTAIVDLSETIQNRKNLAPLAKFSELAIAFLSSEGWSVERPSGFDFGAPQLRR
jgi:hypothetical protein